MIEQLLATINPTACRLSRVWRDEPNEGQGLVEYALIILFIALAAFGGLSAFGAAVDGLYQRIIAQLPF